MKIRGKDGKFVAWEEKPVYKCIDCRKVKSWCGLRCRMCSTKITKKNLGKYIKKGATPWNKGKPLTENWRKNLSNSLKGRISPNKGKIGLVSFWKGKHNPNLMGEKNPNWKNGISQLNRTERKLAMGTLEYKLWREEVFKRNNYTCVICNTKGGYLHADHIKEWANFPELRYEINNGQTLCNDCHYLKTFGREIPDGIEWGVVKNV